jgi:hypothetical protein
MTRCPPRLAVALLERFVPDHDPLTGDLLEEWSRRTNAWFWRQVLSAICTLMIASIRAQPRAAVDATLAAIALLTLVGFCAIVAASLLHQMVVGSELQWLPASPRDGRWAILSGTLSSVVAVLIGRTAGRLHDRHRVAVIIACGASATAAAFANLALFVPSVPNQPFFPHPVRQLAVATLFVVGLFAGSLSRSACEPLSSS